MRQALRRTSSAAGRLRRRWPRGCARRRPAAGSRNSPPCWRAALSSSTERPRPPARGDRASRGGDGRGAAPVRRRVSRVAVAGRPRRARDASRGHEPLRPPARYPGMAASGGGPPGGASGQVSDEMLVRALYAEHAGPLLRYTLHLTSGDRQRAEDIVQETLVKAWLHPDAIADRPARPWLFAVARNLAVDSYRARRARPREVGEAAL